MPTDRNNANNGRPLMPTLASTRTAKTPLTPRLAASSTTSTSAHSRRSDRTDPASTPRVNAASRDDLSTPVKSLLSSNITPRSSSRKSRVGTSSAQSTPNATPSNTPSSSRPPSNIDAISGREHGYGGGGLGIHGMSTTSSAGRSRSVVSGSNGHDGPVARPLASPTYNTFRSEPAGARESSSMFFHASEAKAQQHPPPLKRAATFFYANGTRDESPPRSSGMPSPPLSSVERSRPQPHSYHLDSAVEAKPNSPLLSPPPLVTSPDPLTLTHTAQKPASLHPPSPSKDNFHLSYRKGASQVIRPPLHSRPSILPGQSPLQPQNADFNQSRTARRKSSADSAFARMGHGKSASLSSIDSGTPTKKALPEGLAPITPSPLQTSTRIVSNGSLPDSVASAPTPPRQDFTSPQSPTKPTNSLQDKNELAANARRERKVLDLEISNSSLLAINRSLEREVRKQKAELRRYRRMSRAGRFSTSTIHSVGDLSALADGDFGDLSDLEEDKDPDDEDDREEYSSESSFDEGAMSPTALADRDAGYRLKDEKRLQLDLSKHRELLEDSQKMNQSLKKCLGWTEELINEGKKALAYQVRVSDIQLGGRVLASEDQNEENDDAEKRGGTLLSAWTAPDRSDHKRDRVSTGSERTDRDSGVELEGGPPDPLSELSEAMADMGIDIEGLGLPSPRKPRTTDILGETF